jgi:uncharacterized protein (TIGR00297 family)
MLTNLAIGLAVGTVMGVGGYRTRSLSESGVAGAILIGAATFGLGGVPWGLLLVAFFVSSSALSHRRAADKEEVAKHFDKGTRRDIWQAMANGGPGALIAVAHALWPGEPWWFAYVGAMATVNADTWATEIGVLSRRAPILVTTLRPVPAGTSGGVTPVGTAAALAGAAFIGAVGAVFLAIERALVGGSFAAALWTVPVAAAAGLGGSLLDSVIGATVQKMYRCPACGQDTEQVRHRACGGATTRHVRGLTWMNNDAVNFTSALLGAAAGALLGWLAT